MKVEIEIEELVLHGFPTASQEAVAASLARELARLITERGLPETWRHGATLQQVQGTPARLAPAAPGGIGGRKTAPAERLGTEVARSIYGGWNR